MLFGIQVLVNDPKELERIREEEEYELYREQYPFDEYYHFKEEFKCEWE